MARVETIVVGGGIGAGSPFALNFVPIIGSVDPPLLISTDFLFTVPTGVNRGLIVGLTDPAPGPERLRVRGGCILEPLTGVTGTCIGDGTDSTADGQILIGIAVAAGAGSTNSVVIGNAAVSGTTAAAVVIGQGSSLAGASGTAINATCSAGGSAAGVNIEGTASGGAGGHVNIGGVITITTGVVAVGMAVQVNDANSTVVGFGATSNATGGCAFGSGANVLNNHNNSIALGNGCQSITPQTFSVGSNVGAEPITTVIVGHGLNTVANPTGVTFRLTNASGTNNPAGNYTVVAGLSTGNVATGGNIVFQTGAPGASGATLQTATTRLTIGQALITSTLPILHPAGTAGAPSIRFTDADTGLFEQAAGNVAISAQGTERARFDATAVATQTALLLFDVDNGALERVTVGAADSGGAGFKVLRIPN